MRIGLFFSLLLVFILPNQHPNTQSNGPGVVVMDHRWSRSRQTTERLDPATTAPAASVMTPANKNWERNVRINNSVGARDPNADTVDGRAAAIEKTVQESRTAPKVVDGFSYRLKVKNASPGVVEVLFWEYQFADPVDPNITSRRQFLCGVNIKPNKEKEVEAFSVSGPGDVVSVTSLGNKSGSPYQEKAVINRVEFADGTIWQRKDWNFVEIRLTYQRAISTPWSKEMCRGL